MKKLISLFLFVNLFAHAQYQNDEEMLKTKNEKLEQKEEYLSLKTSIVIADSIFNNK